MPISLRRSRLMSTVDKQQQQQSQQQSQQQQQQASTAVREAPTASRSPDNLASGSTTPRPLGVPLASVHETTRASSPRRPPPSAFRAIPTSSNPQLSRAAKGKDRDDSSPAHQRVGRAPWVCDSDESRRGAGIWQQSERVILVLGEVSRSVLAPLLYSSAFEDTLILVGSVSPLPEIEALSSPSQLLNASDGRTIYPTIQTFVVPPALLATTTPQAAILQQGAALAQASRRPVEAAPSLQRPPSATRSRRGSASSLRSFNGAPSVTPPTTKRRLLSFGQRSSESPISTPRGSTTDLSALGQQITRPSSAAGDNSSDERTGLRSRLSAIIRNDNFSREGSPFDAVINFIPSPPPNIEPQRALQEMLQYTVVLTSAAMPVLMSAATDNSVVNSLAMTELAPLSLVHIVPVDAPPALAPVIERFLLPLLPSMGKRVRRDLFGVVTGLGAWLAPQSDPVHTGLPGAETILFGGVRCPTTNVNEEERPQAMLAGWDHCQLVPGMLVEMEREEPAPVFSNRASALELSNLRTSRSGHSREPSTSSVLSISSVSPPKSPRAGATSPSIAASTSGSALPRGTASRSSSPPQSASASTQSHRSSLVPRTSPDSITSDTSRSGSGFTSRFDPRVMAAAKDQNGEASALTTKPLPNGPGGEVAEGNADMFGLGGSAPKKRTPSSLRYTVTVPQGQSQSLQASPPTPDLDTSGSSCSSSSVIEPSFNEKPLQRRPSHGLLRSLSSRKGFGFTSLFRRNSVRA